MENFRTEARRGRDSFGRAASAPRRTWAGARRLPPYADNVARLKHISGQDEVSFHMSGTEAVMQAVRLARYHTRRTHLVCFCGAYHWLVGDVQPGVGNPLPSHETYTLADMSAATLRVLGTRRDIACVLVNPCKASIQIWRRRRTPRWSTVDAAPASTKRRAANYVKRLSHVRCAFRLRMRASLAQS